MATLEDRLIELELDYGVDLSHIVVEPCCEVCDDDLIAEIRFELEDRETVNGLA